MSPRILKHQSVVSAFGHDIPLSENKRSSWKILNVDVIISCLKRVISHCPVGLPQSTYVVIMFLFEEALDYDGVSVYPSVSYRFIPCIYIVYVYVLYQYLYHTISKSIR